MVTTPPALSVSLDLEIGRGVTAAPPDWFVGVGLGIRTAALRPRRRQPAPGDLNEFRYA